MFEKSDQNFQALLDDPDKLEKRISTLRTVRLLNTATAALGLIAFFVCFFMLLGHQSKGTPPGFMLMVFILLNPVISAMMSHFELRTLMMFKKLRDTTSVTTP